MVFIVDEGFTKTNEDAMQGGTNKMYFGVPENFANALQTIYHARYPAKN